MAFDTAEEALEVLRDLEKDEGERIEAAESLGRIGTIACIGPMFALLERSEVGLATAISRSLNALNAAALLARDLRLGDLGRRRMAATGLVRLADPRAQEALEGALGDEDDQVRVQAVEALCRLEDSPVQDALRRALGDASADVRCMAAYGLGKRGDASDRARLEAALDTETDEVCKRYYRTALRSLAG